MWKSEIAVTKMTVQAFCQKIIVYVVAVLATIINVVYAFNIVADKLTT